MARDEYPVGNVFLAKLQNKPQIIHNLTILWFFKAIYHSFNEDFTYFLMTTKGSLDITLIQCRLSSPWQMKEYQAVLASALPHTYILLMLKLIQCREGTILFTSKRATQFFPMCFLQCINSTSTYPLRARFYTFQQDYLTQDVSPSTAPVLQKEFVDTQEHLYQ